MSFYDQSEFEIRCEWGIKGVEQLAPISNVVIIVDVLSFSTCVEIATSRGAIVFPFQWKYEDAREFATSVGAELALKRSDILQERGVSHQYSLSPQSLSQVPAGTRLVLPSPNGSTLSLMTGNTLTLVGCLRNSRAVAEAAMSYGSQIAVIPAGEKWLDSSLCPAFEDWIGAGAILSHLQGSFSPEAESAIAAYHQATPNLKHLLKQCSSGKELIGKGFEADVDLAAELDVSEGVSILRHTPDGKLGARAYTYQTA
ncbi:2-phosphosulfolactate phosphatase [Aerosakkonemataceae cyanobacterium BLCC-F50]|uniref:Probable 2-phosphosulfolactate phosphatase n=1 Tax=Floridaenema flaviceps BLCC-F50 TaxID=3153642 RepID=A0ABV4XUD3_9CYAN